MSECRWCDMCGKPYSANDVDSRRLSVEEPVITHGTARTMQTVEPGETR